jgi:hypothetical protein
MFPVLPGILHQPAEGWVFPVERILLQGLRHMRPGMLDAGHKNG